MGSEAKFWTDTARVIEHHWDSGYERGELPTDLGPNLGDTYFDALFLGQHIINRMGVQHPNETPLSVGLHGLGLVHWAKLGSPTFNLTHGAATAFALTDASALCWEDFKLPLPFLSVTLPPDGPISIAIEDGTTEETVTRITAFTAMLPTIPNDEIGPVLLRYQHLWRQGASAEAMRRVHDQLKLAPTLWVQGDTAKGAGVHRIYRIPEDPRTPLEGLLSGSGPGEWWAQRNKHSMRVICQILASLCAYLDASGTTGSAKWEPARLPKNRTEGKLTTWVIGSEIKMPQAMREVARAYGRADRDAPAWELKSRIFVRGYWRMQPHGKGGLERRRQWVEPYFKGPDIADVVPKLYRIGPGA